MRITMRMVIPPLFACVLALAAGICGDNAFAQDENQKKKTIVSTFGTSGARIGTVKNAPFSGEMVCEGIQTFADGNRIVNRMSFMIYRDREGRMRRETSFKIRDAGSGEYKEQKKIQVSDPFGGHNFTLDPQNRTAHKSTFLLLGPMREIPGVRSFQPVEGGLVSNGGAIATGNVCGPRPIRAVGGLSANAETNNESLGTQVIEGVAAEGTRITQTIPVGSINNERPIEIIYERWFSPELQLDLSVKSVDPRSGEWTQQFININRGDPDASLFEIPSDYTVQGFKPQVMSMDDAARSNLLREKMDKPLGAADERITVGELHPMSASLRPTIIYKEKGRYTEEARQNRIEGTVVLNVVFRADGRITNIRVVRGLPDGLTEKAIEAARRIRFDPAVKDGVPVSVQGNIEFAFVLDK
jgi:TonB family protein